MILKLRYSPLLIMVLSLSGCGANHKNTTPADTAPPFVALGAPSSHHVWGYLCGLSENVDSEKDNQQQVLNKVGKKLNITFLAITPQHRCSYLDNKLCWPSEDASNPNKISEETTLRTYQEIKAALGQYKNLAGFIGFSNGGIFLSRLAQYVELNKPLIAIGAAGPLINRGKGNRVYLMISKNEYHYNDVTQFYADAQQSLLQPTLVEHNGGHEIPEKSLERLLTTIECAVP